MYSQFNASTLFYGHLTPKLNTLLSSGTLTKPSSVSLHVAKMLVFPVRNGLSSTSQRKREKETDILITSLALRKPGTQREITVIITDQHVCFLRIDAL